jgi:hypothetical protein
MTLILEFSVVAFSEHFPVKDTDGCTIVTVKDFDFSSCKECGYDDKQQMSHHGKSRRLVMFKCGDRPQLAERKSQAENVLQRPCTGAKGYKAMACVSERHIRDAAFMVVDARSATEEQSHAALARKSPLKRYTDNRCRCLPNFNLCRQWHNISASQLQDLKQKVKQYDTTQNDMQSVWVAIQAIATIRCQLSADRLHADSWPILAEVILLHDELFRKALRFERFDNALEKSERFLIKTCPPFLKQQYIHEIAAMEPILANGRNLYFREFGDLINFYPYRHLLTFAAVRENVLNQKRLFMDVGANGFSASPKQIVDMYAAYLPFHQVVMFEPHIQNMQFIPKYYTENMNVTFHQQYVEIGTNLMLTKDRQDKVWSGVFLKI